MAKAGFETISKFGLTELIRQNVTSELGSVFWHEKI